MITLHLLLAIIAFILAVISGIMARLSTPSVLATIAIALLAIIHILGGTVVVR
jgi:hypothetical protein